MTFLLSNIESILIKLVHNLVTEYIKMNYNKDSYNYENKCIFHSFWEDTNKLDLKIKLKCDSCKKEMSNKILYFILLIFHDVCMYTEKNLRYLKEKKNNYNVENISKKYKNTSTILDFDYKETIRMSKDKNYYYKYFDTEYSDTIKINKINHFDLMIIYKKNHYLKEGNEEIEKEIELLVKNSIDYDRIILTYWKIIMIARDYEKLDDEQVVKSIVKLYNLLYFIIQDKIDNWFTSVEKFEEYVIEQIDKYL